MAAFRALDDASGKPMVGNYRPPCPLHHRTVATSLRCPCINMLTCIAVASFLYSPWIREFLPLGAPVSVFLISSQTER